MLISLWANWLVTKLNLHYGGIAWSVTYDKCVVLYVCMKHVFLHLIRDTDSMKGHAAQI